MNRKFGAGTCFRSSKLENLTVREREVGRSPVIREFEFVFLTVGNPYRNGRRERISS
jgi:hypothetical protein